MIKPDDDITLDNNSVFTFYYPHTIKFIKSSKNKLSKKHYGKLDVIDYARKLQIIWNSIKQDDPYAEEALIEVERRLDKAFALMDSLHNNLDDILAEKIPGITIKIKQPAALGKISLDDNIFFTFHSIMGVRLIGQHESLIAKLNTGKKYGLVSNDIYKSKLKKSEGAIVSILSAAKLYKRLGVTRQDIFKKTEKAKEAMSILGEPSLDILDNTRASQHGPKSHPQKRIH